MGGERVRERETMCAVYFMLISNYLLANTFDVHVLMRVHSFSPFNSKKKLNE